MAETLSSIQPLHTGVPSIGTVFLENDFKKPVYQNRVKVLVTVVLCMNEKFTLSKSFFSISFLVFPPRGMYFDVAKSCSFTSS